MSIRPKKGRTAVLVTVVVMVVGLAMCGVAGLVLNRIPDFAGCEEGPPYVSGVQDVPTRVAEMLPALGAVTATHYRFAEARRKVCPEIVPMTYTYDGFATLAPEAAQTLRAKYRWTPADAPAVPAELTGFAPPNPVWERSAELDDATRAQVRFDQATATVYFTMTRT